MSADVAGRTRRVPGTFTIDRQFDGVRQTSADSILHVVTGAGGKHLYDAGWTDNPTRSLHQEDGNADYVVKMVTDRHSFTLCDVDGPSLTMSQIDESGQEFDHITVTKA